MWVDQPMSYDDLDNGIREIYCEGIKEDDKIKQHTDKSVIERANEIIRHREAFVHQVFDWIEEDIKLYEKLFSKEGVIHKP